jgi:hypothetical protein
LFSVFVQIFEEEKEDNNTKRKSPTEKKIRYRTRSRVFDPTALPRRDLSAKSRRLHLRRLRINLSVGTKNKKWSLASSRSRVSSLVAVVDFAMISSRRFDENDDDDYDANNLIHS